MIRWGQMLAGKNITSDISHHVIDADMAAPPPLSLAANHLN